MTSHEHPPIDETTQWSGPEEGDPRDPMILGDALKLNPIAQQVEHQISAQVRAAEAELQALLDDRKATNEQIADAMDRLDVLRAKESGQPPTQG